MHRTTLALEPEVMDLARSMSQERKISISEAVNHLIRRGLNATTPIVEKSGFAVFTVPANAESFGPDEVEKALLDA